MLAVLGSAVGNSRVVRLKRGWDEGASIFAATIADPGEKKTPAHKVAMEPAVKKQAAFRDDYRRELDEHKREAREYEVDKKQAARDGRAASPPPNEPVMERTVVEDTTVEALAVVLEGTPRGVLATRDELSAWARSMNQYKQGGRGADRQFWLSAWSNSYASVDRKSRTEPLILQRPSVGVFGSIQPGVLPELGEGREDGLLDRFLFAYPDPVPSRWTDDEISDESRAAYKGLYDGLRALHMGTDDHGDPDPTPVVFAPDAKAVLVDAVNGHRREMERPGFPTHLKGPWSKLEAYLARFCLISALARAVSDGDPERIETGDVLAAVVLLGYFKDHARRVYDALHGQDRDARLAEDVAGYLGERGGHFEGTATELHERLESAAKPVRPEDLSKRLKAIAERWSALDYDSHTVASKTPEGKATTRRVVNLTLRESL
jgi:hypothetical protein